MTALASQDGTYNTISLQIPYYVKQIPVQNRCANCNMEYGYNMTAVHKNIYCYRCKVSMSKIVRHIHILTPVNEIDEIKLQKKELQMKTRLEYALKKMHEFKENKKKEEVLPRHVLSKHEEMKRDFMEFINAPKEQQTMLFRRILQKEIDSRKKFSEDSHKLREQYNPGMTDFSELDYMTKKFNIILHVGRVKDLQKEQKKLFEQIVANSIGEKYDSNITIEERKIIIATLQINIAVDKLEREGRI